jgi:Aspartyl/Asparaginyl beta-hydroxylase
MNRLWIEGLRLWYNEQDYLSAMECWDELLGDSSCSYCEATSPVVLTGTLVSHSSECEARVSPLLVFMAGCHLDAHHVSQARRYLLRAIRASSSVDHNEVAIQALHEYVTSLDEEAHQDDDDNDTNGPEQALSESRRIISWAIQQGSTQWKDPYQRPGYLHPLRQAKPWYDRHEHPPWCRTLEQHSSDVRDEFRLLAGSRSVPTHWPQVGSGHHRGGAGQHDDAIVDGDWREVVLFGSGATQGVAPKTCALIETHVPEAVHLAQAGGGEVIFSVLAPRTRLRPHCGTTNLRLTAHLGLSVPATGRCEIRVGEERRQWKEGQVLLFDDSFEHEVINDTNESRAVLLLRFWHPSLPTADRQQAMAAALQAKEDDANRRYNPPVPSEYGTATRNRGLKRDSCSKCSQTGYGSIRVGTRTYAQNDDVSFFACTCGEPII